MSKLPLIAIVDDDAAMRDAFGDRLQVAGFSAQTYSSAAAFLEDYSPGRFDVVITDLKMPKMDGVELLQRLRAKGAAPPVIVVTSSVGTVARARAMEMGAFACLSKPVADDELLKMIGALLGPKGKGLTPEH